MCDMDWDSRFFSDNIHTASNETLIERLRANMKLLDEHGRLEIIRKLQEGYCADCMRDDPRCQCWNDD